MRDEGKTKAQLVREVSILRAKLKKLEKAKEARTREGEALPEREEWNQSVVDNSEDAILLTVPDGRILAANPAACKMFGRTEAEICQLGRNGVIDTKDPRLSACLERRRKTGKFKGELNLLRRDGTIFPGDVSTVVFRDSRGNESTSVIIRDTAERKRAEDALRDSQERFRAIADYTANWENWIDPDGRLVWVNPAVERITGYSVKEFLAKHALSQFICAEEDQTVFREQFDRAMRGSRENDQEFRFVRKDGTKRWGSVSWQPIFSSDGKALGHRSSIRDITERKKAEEAVVLLAHAIRSIGECVSITDTDNKILFVNDAFLRTYGYTADEIIGKLIAVVRSPRSEPSVEKVLSTTLEGGWQGELVNRRKDGTEFPISLSTSVVRNEKGQPIALVGIAADITGRKRVEEALNASEQDLQNVVSNSPDTIYTIDLITGKARFLNRDKFCGYSRQELESRGAILGSVHPDELGAVEENWAQIIVGKDTVPVEYRLREKGGDFVWIRQRVTVMARNQDGSPNKLLVTLSDITERKQMEDALRKEHALLSSIIETIPDEICVKDLDSRYIIVNKASVAALGAKSLEEMIGKTDLDYVRRDLALRLLAEEKEILESGKPSIGREMVRRDPKTGDISKCDLYTKVPIKDPDGKAVGLLVVNVDITQRKLAEEKVRRSELRLRQLSAHLESVREEERKHISQEFHDQLGQTLTALKMDLSLLERGLIDKTKEISRTALIEDIRSSQGLIDRGIQTVRAIMSELRPELLDQLGLVEALEWEVGKFQQRSGILCGLIADVGDLQFDARRSIALFRLVQESLTNVARHAQATQVDVIMRTEGNDLILEIKDDGIGITFDAENKPRSFGLMGMRERAVFLGGNLEITGTMGKGTNITVRMPIHETLPDGGGEKENG